MKLEDFFAEHNKLALAFSGGADSAFLLYYAVRCGADVAPFFIKSQFQPEFERRDAMRLADELGVRLREIDIDVLQLPEVSDNPANRCYYCKCHIMSEIRAAAAKEGYDTVIDGTNASDDGEDRPGMRVLSEENILSPLRICKLTKADVRRMSREARLFTWNKPAYACLATRIPTGEKISAEKLRAVEMSEDYLFSLGYSDFRVRLREGGALLQFTAKQREKAENEIKIIENGLKKYFDIIKIDSKARDESI